MLRTKISNERNNSNRINDNYYFVKNNNENDETELIMFEIITCLCDN